MGGGGGRRQRTDPDGPGDLLKKMEEGGRGREEDRELALAK